LSFRVRRGQSDGCGISTQIPHNRTTPRRIGRPIIDIAGAVGENGGGFGPTPGIPAMCLRNAIKTLLVLVLALPLVAAVLVWVVGLLRAMGDEPGAAVVGYVGTGCQIIWLVCLVGLLVTLALAALETPPPPPPRGEQIGQEERELE
jgi:hypothetical protein